MTKILRSIYFDKKQVERLIALSSKTRIPQAVLMREGIDLVLKKHGEYKKGRISSERNEVKEKRCSPEEKKRPKKTTKKRKSISEEMVHCVTGCSGSYPFKLCQQR